MGDHEPADLRNAPFQIFQAVGRHSHKDIHIVKVLVIGQALLQIISGSNCAFDVIEVRIGVRCILDSAAVDTDLLTELCLDPLLGFPLKVEINIDSLAGIDK